ncbi:hypothetical protein CkaCkLH20_13334 [Colletotrichum karsti]|uniref:Uncharacterized protein n=1 Tax=Colletotrichum karsti TaxID=1095194 RepID=A0A9P6LEG0_9PEZI|nr:uncharacterized protein CkaCkLH20_13334 [Colletotrichum karsti]KAF9869192.1 hypothetical protein CkaCkLH20_13334 [Colletotrichum karsti]
MKNPDHRCMVWDTYKSCGHCVSMKEGCSLNPESKKKKRSSAAQEKAETESNTVLDDKKKPPAKCRKTRRKASPRTEARASEPDNEPLEATKVTPPEERSGPAPKANSQGLQLGMVFDAFTEPLSSIDAAGELASMPASTTGTEGETRLRILAAAACAFLPLEATEGTRSEERSGPAPKANPEGPQGGVVFDAFTEPLSSREIAGEPAQMPANLAGTEGDTAFQALATTAGAFLESMDSAAPARHPSGWTPINMPRRAPVNSPANTAANDFIDRSMSISSLLN